MKLDKKTKDKYEHGDIKKIHEETKISAPTVGNAIRTGRGSRKTIIAITEFYNNIN